MQASVVIVDEDVNARIIAETLLQVRGIDVRVAADGTEACEIVRRHGAAVVVVDLAPGTNGIEAIRKLSGRFEALPLTAQPRIVALSNSNTPDLERFVLRLGADVLLHKPVAPAQFVLTVERLIRLPRLAHVLTANAS